MLGWAIAERFGPYIPPENIRKPEVFRGYRKRLVAWNGLRHTVIYKYSCTKKIYWMTIKNTETWKEWDKNSYDFFIISSHTKIPTFPDSSKNFLAFSWLS